MDTLIKKLMGDMNPKFFGPLVTILFVLIYGSHAIFGVGIAEMAVLAVIAGVVVGVAYGMIVPATPKEEAKAEARLDRIEKFFGNH